MVSMITGSAMPQILTFDWFQKEFYSKTVAMLSCCLADCMVSQSRLTERLRKN